jgi:hypothetical protein
LFVDRQALRAKIGPLAALEMDENGLGYPEAHLYPQLQDHRILAEAERAPE